MYQNRSEMDCKRDFSSPNSSKTERIPFLERKILKMCTTFSILQTSVLNPHLSNLWMIPNPFRCRANGVLQNRARSCDGSNRVAKLSEVFHSARNMTDSEIWLVFSTREVVSKAWHYGHGLGKILYHRKPCLLSQFRLDYRDRNSSFSK